MSPGTLSGASILPPGGEAADRPARRRTLPARVVPWTPSLRSSAVVARLELAITVVRERCAADPARAGSREGASRVPERRRWCSRNNAPTERSQRRGPAP